MTQHNQEENQTFRYLCDKLYDAFIHAMAWPGLDWTGLNWTGLMMLSYMPWPGLDWTGLDWTGLDWTVFLPPHLVLAALKEALETAVSRSRTRR